MKKELDDETFEELMKEAAFEVEFEDKLKSLKELTKQLNQDSKSKNEFNAEMRKLKRGKIIKIVTRLTAAAAILIAGLFAARNYYCYNIAEKYIAEVADDNSGSRGYDSIQDSLSTEFLFDRLSEDIAKKLQCGVVTQRYDELITKLDENDNMYYPTKYYQALNLLKFNQITSAKALLQEVANNTNYYQEEAQKLLLELDKWWLF